jgi:hypothetical protein
VDAILEVKGGKKMIRNRTMRTTRAMSAGSAEAEKPLSISYTYVGNREEEASGLRSMAQQLAKLGKVRLARALMQLAKDLETGVVFGAVAPGDTLYVVL